MKQNIKKYTIKSILFLVGFAFLVSCAEMIVSPNENGSDVSLYIVGQKLTVCKGDTVVTPASYADFSCIRRKTTGDDEMLFSGKLNELGIWDSIYNIELLGIPDVRTEGWLDLKMASDSVFYVCCDTSFLLNFFYDCEEIEETEVSCEALSDTVNLTFTNLVGGNNILLNTADGDVLGNIYRLNSTESVVINVNEALALSGDFSAKMSPMPDASGNIYLGNGNSQLTIEFDVNTGSVGDFTKSLTLTTTCENQLAKGAILINLSASVVDNDCACPYASSGDETIKSFYPFSSSIALGKSADSNSLPIVDADKLGLAEGCYLVIDSISRYQSDVSVSSLGDPVKHEWTITNSAVGLELRNGVTSYVPSVTFTPRKIDANVDTFSVYVSIHNSNGESKDQCSFLIYYEGDCCNSNVCPTITKLNSLPCELIDAVDNSVIRPLSLGSTIEMGSGNIIAQTMNGIVGTLCASFETENQNVSFSVNVEKSDSVKPCSNVTVSVEKQADGAIDDSKYFSLINSTSTIWEGDSAIFTVRFNTPDIEDYISSGHSSVYKAKLIVSATDNYFGELCSQEITLEANVSNRTYKISKSTNMKAFSQISDNDQTPSYAAYKIDKYNSTYQYYGQQDKLFVSNGTVSLLTTPPTPTTDHSFFFEVDQPQNLTLSQEPKLYLVNNILNKYTMISAQPVARYSNNTSFNNDLDNLMQELFKNEFQSRGNAPNTSFEFNPSATQVMWTPSKSASDLAGSGNGLPIKMGEVYVIWDPAGSQESFSNGGKVYTDYCDVALVYIEEVSTGENASHHIGNVTFYVVYPMTTVIR